MVVKLDHLFWRVKRLFALAFDDTNSGKNKVERNSHQKYFLSRVNISNYKISIDGSYFYDQTINNLSKKNSKRFARLKDDKVMIIRQDVSCISSILKTITN